MKARSLRVGSCTVVVLAVSAIIISIFGSQADIGARSITAAGKRCSPALPPSAYLNRRDLGRFALIVSQTYSRLPLRTVDGQTKRNPLLADFCQSHITGYVSQWAVHGPYVASEKRLERRLGYTGSKPLVPLEGSIVEHYPGVLELYETVSTFRNRVGAWAWLQHFRNSFRLDPYYHFVSLPRGVASGVAVSGTLGPKKPGNEDVVYYVVKEKDHVVQLAIQGGAHVLSSSAAPYLRLALLKLKRYAVRGQVQQNHSERN